MLKKYVKTSISKIRKNQLSHKVIIQTLESAHCNCLPAETCRDLCYMYMRGPRSFKLLCLSRKAFPDIKDDESIMQMVAKMAKKAEGFFVCEEIDRYRKSINDEEIRDAMAKCKVNPCLDLMPMLVATFVVDGEHGLNVIKPVLEEAGVTNADVKHIVREIGFEK